MGIEKLDVLNREKFIEEVVTLAEVTSENKQICCFSIVSAKYSRG